MCPFSAMDDILRSKMFKDGGFWQCFECNYRSKYTTSVYRHIEAKHIESQGLVCNLCGKVSATRNGLKQHMAVYHQTNQLDTPSISPLFS